MPPEPQDIFSDVNTGTPTPSPSSNMGGSVSTPPSMSYASKGGNIGKIIIIVVLVVVLVGIIAAGAYYLAQNAPAPVQPLDQNQPTVDTTTDTTVPVDETTTPVDETTTPVDETTTPVDEINPAGLIDVDGDGLTNAQEEELGTDPGSLDTDSDGLFDNEEVNIYNTDPTNPDTDGDGFEDGQEVANGYNPNGPGLLFNDANQL